MREGGREEGGREGGRDESHFVTTAIVILSLKVMKLCINFRFMLRRGG